MSPHITYHPIGTDTIRRYVGYLSAQDPAAQAGVDYDASGAHTRFRQPLIDIAVEAPTLTGVFDETHGLNLAASQGFFGRFHYVHDARLSALHALIAPYSQGWHDLIPTWPATESATNQLADVPASGVFLAADQIGAFMHDVHVQPELKAALGAEFPGEKLHVLWAALNDALGSGRALLEASGVMEPDPEDLAQSSCRTNQTNCEPAGLRLFLSQTVGSAAPAQPSVARLIPDQAPIVEPPESPESLVAADAASADPAPPELVPPPPVADGGTISQMDWEPAVVMLGNAHDDRENLVFGPLGFLESWDNNGGINNLALPASRYGMGLWLDWAEDYLLEERCRALADWRVGWSDEDLARREELQFSWDGRDGRGHVDQGLAAFDRWLQLHGSGLRLISVITNSDFYVSFLYPGADAHRFIEALGAAGLSATLQDGTIPSPTADGTGATATAQSTPQPARKMPGAPSLAERMRVRSDKQPPTN